MNTPPWYWLDPRNIWNALPPIAKVGVSVAAAAATVGFLIKTAKAKKASTKDE